MKALSDWKANGGQIYMQFVDIASPSQYGQWGALESFMDTVTPLSAAPIKWQALQNFIASNPAGGQMRRYPRHGRQCAYGALEPAASPTDGR